MLGIGKQHSRLCVMEALFAEFQKSMLAHMEGEERVFKEFRESHKEIIAHIDQSQKDTWKAAENMKKEILHTVDKEHFDKAEVSKQLTELRGSLMDTSKEERSKTLRDVRMGVLLILATLSGCGWWYVNIAIPAANHHIITGLKK